MKLYVNCITSGAGLRRDIKELIPEMNLRRRMSRVVKSGVAAGIESLLEFGDRAAVEAVVTATGLGCIADSEKFLDSLIANEERMLNPTPFIQSTFNTVGAQIALLRGLHCYNTTYANRWTSFENALTDAALRIGAGFALFYCSYQIRLGAYVRSLCRNRAAGRVVALTFDDGPDPEQTPRVLDTLRAHGVRATFFLIGSKAELHPEIVRRMAAEGHAIGIHTWSHTPGFPMLRSGAMAADILRCRESLREITGVETDLFRPPYGVTNPMVARAVKRTGSRCVGWSIRSLDTLRQRSREAVARRIRRRLGDGKVILLHDDRPGAERLLAMVLNDLQRGGYRTATVCELFKTEKP